MNDLFQTETNQQLMREARIGLTLLAVTLGVFSYVVYQRLSSSGTELPEHVLRAPIAEAVWPGENPAAASPGKQNPTLQTSFGNMISNARKTFGLNLKRNPNSKTAPSDKPLIDPIPKSALTKTQVPSAPKPKKPVEFELSSVLRQSVGQAKKTKLIGFDNSPSKNPNAPKKTIDLGVPAEKQLKRKSNSSTVDTKSTNLIQKRDLGDDNPSNSFEPLVNKSKPPILPTPSASRIEGFSSIRTNPDPIHLVSAELPRTVDIATELKENRVLPSIKTNPYKTSFTSLAKPAKPTKTENEYASQAGDSFWSIAQAVYDDGRLFRALFEYNRKRVGSFENLGPGVTIRTPPLTELQKLWPELCPKVDDSKAVTDIDERIYLTKTGDTLFEIARQRLGQASQYLAILEANKEQLGPSTTHLTPLPSGVRLRIPYTALH